MDSHHWVAAYTDGTSLARYNEDSTENGYADIDRSRLRSFEVRSDISALVVKVFFERPTQQLVYRRRNHISMLGVPQGTTIIVGWQEKVGGKSHKSLIYLYPDGHIELDGARNDLELLPIEE
jgi:hypothetical protein